MVGVAAARLSLESDIVAASGAQGSLGVSLDCCGLRISISRDPQGISKPNTFENLGETATSHVVYNAHVRYSDWSFDGLSRRGRCGPTARLV